MEESPFVIVQRVICNEKKEDTMGLYLYDQKQLFQLFSFLWHFADLALHDFELLANMVRSIIAGAGFSIHLYLHDGLLCC